MNSKIKTHICNFEQIRVGDEASFEHQITWADIQTFANLTGDRNPLHLDEDFARRVSFGKPVVYGMLSASFISTMIGMLLPGPGALWTSQTLEFRYPAYIGDILQVKACVKQKSPTVRAVVLDVVITNQDGRKLITGKATVKILEMRESKPMIDDTTKIVLITGGNRGIGAAITIRLAQEGYTIVINYLQGINEAEQVVTEIRQKGGRALAIQADVAQFGEIEKLFLRVAQIFGPIDVVVHCAAPGSALQSFEQLEWGAIQQQFDVQIKGAYHCVKAALPQMIAAEAGSIIFIGSVAADGVPPPRQSDYVMAKAALAAFARSLAVEYGAKGIRVNVVSPGMTQTDRLAHLPDKAKMLARMQSSLRRLAEPEDVASVVAFLLSSGARYITGETIRVAGGAVMQ